MSLLDTALIEARCDAGENLLSADEPLAALQMRCGGTIPGAIAVPELRELVAKTRSFGLKLARPMVVQDGHDTIRAWIEVTPLSDGCQITLRHWQSTPLPPEPADLAGRRRVEIDRALAEFTARLDARQCVMTAESDAPDLGGLLQAARAGVGRPWTDFITLPGERTYASLHWRLLDGAVVRVAGSERPWRVTLIPHGGAGNDAQGFELCLNSDVPAPQVSAVEAEPVERRASARPSVIGRELAPILRQPIARIIANAETIRTRRAGPLSSEYADYAHDIASAGQHLLELVEDLADIEVIESRGFAPAADRIDLADVARRAAGILGVRAREKGITIAVPDAQAHLPAIGEFRRVLQVLLNLIGNAIRYTPENSTISIQLTRSAERARIAIVDQGAGFTEEHAAKVFNKFERLGRSGDGGSGLGLYISRRLARAMGGDLTVESEHGLGACFTLDLPAAF